MSYNTLTEWSQFASPQAFRQYATLEPGTVQRCLDVAQSFINSKLTGAFQRSQLPLVDPPYVIKDCEMKIAAWHLVGALGLPVEGIDLLEKMYLSAVDTLGRLDDGRDTLAETTTPQKPQLVVLPTQSYTGGIYMSSQGKMSVR